MLSQVVKSDVVANNLANANTIGFKKNIVFSELLDAKRGNTLRTRTEQDFSQGELTQTDNPLDFAIAGPGFFTIEGEGREMYTRNGHFTVDNEGFMRSSDGKLVLGHGGWINIAPDGIQPGELNVNTEGEIYADGILVGKLLISDFDSSTAFRKVGNHSFTPKDENVYPDIIYKPTVIQGKLENSNVNPVEEMVNLLELKRRFESNQRTMKSIDEVLRKAAIKISKVD